MKILNSKGEPIVLNKREAQIANHNQRMCNSLGIELNITTLTTILKSVVEQKFFEIKPSDFFPVIVGEGTWSSILLRYRQFDVADDFETGIINQANNGRLAQVNTAVDSVSIKINNWAKEANWNIFQLEQAAKAGQWDLVTSIAEARKRNWDLGVQRVAFLGMASDPSVQGYLTQSGVTIDTTTITQSLSSMTGAQLKTFCSIILGVYRTNCNHSAWPAVFTLPESDYLGLAAPSSADFQIKSVLEVLQDTFRTMTKNPNFKIMPCAYGDNSVSGLGFQRYALGSFDEKAGRMDIPLDYTNSMANTVNGFGFTNVGYGQFTGYVQYRAPELMYFDF